jgi:hypothetical protein
MISFCGVVRLDSSGQLVCFCYEQDVKAGICECRRKFDCPEAKIDISIIPGTRPSETQGAEIVRVNRDVENAIKSTVKSAEKIKEGLSQLEKAIKRNSKFRI